MRLECFKKTSEDWYGNFKISDDARHINDKLVHVSCIKLQDGTWRTCVWGNDDHGLEFDTPFESNALNIFNEICMMDDVTHFRLKELGLIPA